MGMMRLRVVLPVIGLAVALAPGLAGCQDGAKTVGVFNACGYPIQADANDANPQQEFVWRNVAQDDRMLLRNMYGGSEIYYVWTRTGDGGPVTEFSVAKADLSAPPAGNDYDLDVVIEGDRCPVRG